MGIPATAAAYLEVPRILAATDQWQDLASVPKQVVYTDNKHQYGPKILATTTDGRVRSVRWWQYEGDPACNFLDDGGNARFILAWMPMPEPYKP